MQGWIVLLLAILIIIEAVDLYLDHFAVRQPTTAGLKAAAQSEPTKQSIAQPTSEKTVEPQTKTEEPASRQQVVKPAVKPPIAAEIKLQILNGCGVRGIAARVRGIMRDRGFDVMSYGNAARANYPKTLLLVRSEGRRAELAADVVARSLGVNQQQIKIRRDPSLVDIDVTIILGLDYKKLNL